MASPSTNTTPTLSSMYPGQPSSVKTTRPTTLLDLSDELLSLILDFLLPRLTTFPTTPPHTEFDASIGLTCHRLFHLVKPRFQVLDFVYPKSLTYTVSRCPQPVCKNIDKFTTISTPFAEVVRLPTDFVITPAFLPPKWCPNLRQLCLTLSTDVSNIRVRQFFEAHNKLEVLIMHMPKYDLLAELALTRLKLRQLSLTSLLRSENTLCTLDDLFKVMPTLQSLTVSVLNYNSMCQVPPRLRDYVTINSVDRICHPDRCFMSQLSCILRKNHRYLPALRQIAVWSEKRVMYTYRHPSRQTNLTTKVTHAGHYIDTAREISFDKAPDLKITKLQLRLRHFGETSLQKFIQYIVDTSTEVLVEFAHMTVCYPVVVDKSNPPMPIIKKLRIDSLESVSPDTHILHEEMYMGNNLISFEEYYKLRLCAKFELESLTIDKKAGIELLTMDKHQRFLLEMLRGNNLRSIGFHYKVSTAEDVETMIKVLNLVIGFAPNVSEITLPGRIMFKWEYISLDELKDLKCAENVRVLSLCTRFEHYEHIANYEEQVDMLNNELTLWENAEEFAVRVPSFLDKVRQAFPRLTHICMDQFDGLATISEQTFHWVEASINTYEKQTGVDASALRMVLKMRVSDQG